MFILVADCILELGKIYSRIVRIDNIHIQKHMYSQTKITHSIILANQILNKVSIVVTK
jgi:hypothetical protein